MRKLMRLVMLLVLAAASVGWYMSRPAHLSEDWGAGLIPDPESGARIFAAAGCASCHTAPKSEEGVLPVLSGGKSFDSDFGTFYASNISPHPTRGIGDWTLPQFARALTLGVSPEDQHYYPAFPYSSYRLMKPQDVVDVFAYLKSLPQSDIVNRDHEVGLPFSLRRGIGVWKAIYLPDGFTVTGDLSPPQERGRYLAEALGHCAECHTPRTTLGGLQRKKWMEGAPDPSGTGKIPGITRRHLSWSETDLVEYFTSGFTPEYDSAGGDMADVVKNLSSLPVEDREALASYVASLP